MRNKRILYYLFLAFGWTVILFYLSSMSYAEQDIRPYLRMLVAEEHIAAVFAGVEIPYVNNKMSVDNMGGYQFVEFLFRKGAHLFFYSVLGYLLVRYFASSLGRKYWRVFAFSLSILLVIAMLDEFLQFHHPDRSGQWADVWLDGMGGLKGIITGFLSTYVKKNKKEATKNSADSSL
ncbi:VanZ family protein [Sutcliffiella horikoshii]|uniref:VanZ family protein n=1 Tax=Sutcliffiella horikoshii TaxID=79883 RepID=A0A5D4T9N1_9BACI|nr:VanZ family protein [Sutcliffiella horikoshii]TYS72400.1 VanZ family protein [Sutcliffiella horikoshii]